MPPVPPCPPSSPLSSPRSVTPRRAILDATESLLLAGGSGDVTIRAVGELCGYSAPTIYHHFGGKDGLVDAVLEQRFADMLERLRAVPAQADPRAHLASLARAFVDFALENPEHYWLLAGRREADPDLPSAVAARELVFDALAQLDAVGGLACGPPETAFQITWAVLHGLVTLQLSHPDYAWSEDLIDVALAVLERGIVTPEYPKP